MQLYNQRLVTSVALVLFGLSIVSGASFGSECKVIKAELQGSSFLCGESPVGLCSNGVIGGGILKGIKSAVYTAAAPTAGLWTEGPWVLSYSADAIFTTEHGDLYLNQIGVSDTVRKVFTEVNRVVGGTGRFYNASGDLFISGALSTSNIATDFESEITGRLCLAETTED